MVAVLPLVTRWSWHGAVALILAAALAVCLVTLVMRWAFGDHDLTPAGATTLATVLGGIVGAVGTYLGAGTHTTTGNPPAATHDERHTIMTETTPPPDPDNLPTGDDENTERLEKTERVDETTEVVQSPPTEDDTEGNTTSGQQSG